MMIPYGHQDVTGDDIEAVVSVLRSDFLTQGPIVPRFEASLTAYTGATHGVAVSSATSALHIACLALGLGPGDWLWTSPITFVASANCALYCGAQVDFVDIDPRTWNLSAVALERKLEDAAAAGRLPKIVVPVHLCGQPCEMARIHELSLKYRFHIIEDASHAVGGSYCGEPIGDCRYSDVTVFSFHPVKIITTGEGGMAMTNNGDLAERMALLRSHGITRDTSRMTGESDGPWYYQQIDLGFNYRMTEIQAALGLSQMARLDAYVARRHELARCYDARLSDLPLTLPWQHPQTYSGLHLYVVRLMADSAKDRRLSVLSGLRDRGIGANVHYIPVHLQPYYQRLGFRQGDYPEAERYYDHAITLPLYPTMTMEHQDYVVRALRELLEN